MPVEWGGSRWKNAITKHGIIKHCTVIAGTRHHRAHYKVYCNGTDITQEAKDIVGDLAMPTADEQIMLKLKWGIECLPK